MAIDPAQKGLWLQEFHMNGFVVLRDFLPRDLVTAMYDELSPLLEAEYGKEAESNWTRGRAPFRLALDVGPYADLMRGALADDGYRNNPAIEELVGTILGEWRKGWAATRSRPIFRSWTPRWTVTSLHFAKASSLLSTRIGRPTKMSESSIRL